MRKKSNPSPPAIPDEIENFSLDEGALPVNPEAELAVPSEPDAKSTEAPEEGGDTEGAPRVLRRRKEEALPSVQQKMKPELEKIFHIAAMILVPLVFIAVFWAIFMNSGDGSVEAELKMSPTLPMVGNLLTIEELTTGWRDRKENDKVGEQNDILTDKKVEPKKLPMVKLKFTPKVKGACLMITFHNSEGNQEGDPKIITGEDGNAEVAASRGLLTERHLNDYLASPRRRWSVQVSESTDKLAKREDWKVLDTFAIEDIRR